jgi:hypothetical protein
MMANIVYFSTSTYIFLLLVCLMLRCGTLTMLPFRQLIIVLFFTFPVLRCEYIANWKFDDSEAIVSLLVFSGL